MLTSLYPSCCRRLLQPLLSAACHLFTLTLLFLLVPHAARAQDDRAKLTVRVVDPAGAVVPGAALTLTRGSTNTTTQAKTGGDGTYTFLFLDPDTYAVKGNAPGLNTVEVRNIVLGAYAATSTDVSLKVASADTQVTVTSSGAVLETENADRAWNLDQQQVQNLPIPNNNPVMLGEDIPGVYMRPLGAFTDPWTVTSQFLINGGLMYLNEFQLDGNPNDAQFANNVYGYSPPAYAVKQFSVSANSYDAQYGHTSGGVVNLGTISGGDKVHGMGWGFFRRAGWNANSFQNNAIGQPRSPSSQDQFGGQVGGPFVVPFLISRQSRIKPFYFFSVDRYIEKLPLPILASYPEPEMRNGDFSKLTNPNGSQITIYDPASGNAGNGYTRTPFQNNIIPQGRINPIAKAVAALMPLPNVTTAGQRYSTEDFTDVNNFFNWHFYNVLGRFDFNVGDKYKFFVRPYISKFTEVSDQNGDPGPGQTGGDFSRFNRGFLLDFVDVLNPTTIANIRFGYTLYREQWLSPQNAGFDLTTLGLSNSFISQIQQPALFGQWNFQNYNTLGWFQSLNDTGTRSIEGDIEKTLGKHSLRFGEDARLTHYTVYSPNEPFTLQFNSDWTRQLAVDPTNGSEATSGDSFASFLLGTPSSGSTFQNVTNFYSSWYVAPWIQDDWKATRSLTINLGLRYDILVPPTERHNQMNVGFNPTVPNAAQSSVNSSVGAAYPGVANLTGAVEFAGVNGNPTRPFPTNWSDIQPRFGFAYLAAPGLVFRGGYGLFYTNFQSNDMMQDLGFSSTTSINTSPDGGRTQYPNVLNNPLPTGANAPSGAAGGSLTYIGQGFTYYNPHYHIPTANEFSFGFQLRTTKSSVLDMSYVGNRVRNYSMNYNANLPSWNYASQCDEIYNQNGNNNNCFVSTNPNPFLNGAAFKGTNIGTEATIDPFDLNRPHPEFSDVTEEGINTGRNWYNALQTDWSQHLSHGLAFNTSYVWSKQIEQWGWLNQYLGILQRSPYLFNLPQVFKINGTYELPFGTGRLLSLGNNRVADFFLGGWTVAPDFTWQTGEPVNLPGNAIPLRNSFVSHVKWNSYQVKGWGNCVLVKDGNGNTAPSSNSAGCTSYDWLQVPTLPGEQASPSFAANFRMKPMLLSDLALEKNFKFERFNVLLRAQATNALNHYNLLNARFNTDPTSANFGTVFPSQASSLDDPPRNLQVGVRASF